MCLSILNKFYKRRIAFSFLIDPSVCFESIYVYSNTFSLSWTITFKLTIIMLRVWKSENYIDISKTFKI